MGYRLNSHDIVVIRVNDEILLSFCVPEPQQSPPNPKLLGANRDVLFYGVQDWGHPDSPLEKVYLQRIHLTAFQYRCDCNATIT